MLESNKRVEYRKEYYQKNKDKLAAKLSAKEECVYCHKEITHQYMQKHQKTARCLNHKMDIEYQMNRRMGIEYKNEIESKHEQDLRSLHEKLDRIHARLDEPLGKKIFSDSDSDSE
jgi:hypothetical protein